MDLARPLVLQDDAAVDAPPAGGTGGEPDANGESDAGLDGGAGGTSGGTDGSWNDGSAGGDRIGDGAAGRSAADAPEARDLGPPPPSDPGSTWLSWEVTTQMGPAQATVKPSSGATATLEFYESADDGGVTKGRTLSLFVPGKHPEPNNALEKFWTFPFTEPRLAYPYVGKSDVGRGSDSGETAPDSPLGVRDLQVHPPDSNKLIVIAFIAPVGGSYSVKELGVRRRTVEAGSATLYLFGPDKRQEAALQTRGREWARQARNHNLGTLKTGDRIYFATSGDGMWNFDATEISWSVIRSP